MNKTMIGIVIAVFIVAAGAIFVRYQGAQMPKSAQTEQAVNTENVSTSPSQSGPSGESPKSPLVNPVSQITLTISSPATGVVVKNSKLTVKGKTAAKAEVFANEAEGVADASGNFSLTITLEEGENPVVVTAVDPDGNVAEKDFLVTYDVE